MIVQTIHGYVFSNGGFWWPGVYDKHRTAVFASTLPYGELAKLSEEICPLRQINQVDLLRLRRKLDEAKKSCKS